MGKIIIHHLGVSQSDRIVWLCEELGIEYELRKYDRAPALAPPEYKKLHPIEAAPVIEDGNIKLAESGACLEYLTQTYKDGALLARPGDKDYVDFLYWYHSANGTFQPTIMRCASLLWAGANESVIAKRSIAKRDQILEFMDQRLSQVPYLAGEFSAADIMTVFSLTVMRCFYQYGLGPYRNILDYLKRVSERPAYQRAMAKGDPDLDISKLIGASPPPLHKGLAARA